MRTNGMRLLLVWTLAGCSESAAVDREYNADDIASNMLMMGQEVVVRGRVTTITFAQEAIDANTYRPLATRYLLLQTDADHQNLTDGWGLGIELPTARLSSRQWRPAQRGDEIRVRGRLSTLQWDVEMQPKIILSDVTEYAVEHPASALPQVDLGGPCQHDLDCADDLWCERRGVCGTIPPITWYTDLRNINGSCLRDEDCPMGQRCDSGFHISATGDYSPNYDKDRDAGRFLCQVDRAAPAQSLCPHPVDISDYLGGRYPEGKEICVRAQIAFPLLAPDRDTHIQAEVLWPYRYPEAQPALGPFGAAMENAPTYKDPTNPLGPLLDPRHGTTVDLVGTVHYDDKHAWWEMHPLKWIGAAPASP